VSVIGLLVVDAVHKNKELYWIISDFPLFYVCSAIKKCSSARCASSANVVCRDFDIFTTQNASVNHILLQT
jgi:hypothetical protein